MGRINLTEPTFLTPLITEEMIGGNFSRVYLVFKYYSKILDCVLEIPINFFCDYESVPIIKGSSKLAGVIHDYLCRKDSIPNVSKQKAASVYLEAQACLDKLRNKSFFSKINRFFRRHIKTLTVRVAWGYFHKHKVLATLEDLKGGKK